jgi:G:T/U-mismatch repair DNA glycosylase
MMAKSAKSDIQIMQELKDSYNEVICTFSELAVEKIKQKDWKRYKGFTARRSRPGSACDYIKEISEFIYNNQADLDKLLNKFKRTIPRTSFETLDECRKSGTGFLKATALQRKVEPYSVTKMLRQYSSSSSSSSSNT